MLTVQAIRMQLQTELHKSDVNLRHQHLNLIRKSYKKDLLNLQVVLLNECGNRNRNERNET